MKNIYFKNLDIKIEAGELIGIIGPNGCGKTTFLKMICGKISNNYFFIDKKNVNKYDISYKRRNIVSVLNDDKYLAKTPYLEFMHYLNILKVDSVEIEKRIEDFNKRFKLNKIINNDFDEINNIDKIYIKILSLLIIYPTIFCIDDLLTYLSLDRKDRILNFIKDNNITLLAVTSNMEELKYFDKILIMSKGKKILYDKTHTILLNEGVFNELGLELPFIYSLNNMLKNYDLIDKNFYDYEELINELWK